MEFWQDEPFHGVLNRVVQERTRVLRTSPPKLAEKLGPDYRTFMYWLEGKRKFPAELLPKLCMALDDYQLMDMLDREAGRIAFRVPVPSKQVSIDDVKATQRLVKEVGEALESLANTLEDGIVTASELKRTLPELEDVIRECVHLQHWLRERWRTDGRRTG